MTPPTSIPRSASSTARPANILVREVNWLGDAVMTMPALIRLRRAHPEARIAALTPNKLADLWKLFPGIDEVLTFDENETAWSVARRLRAGRFDVGLALPNSPRSAIELWGAGIPRRIGLRGPWRTLFLTDAIAPRGDSVTMRKRTVAEVRKRIQQQELTRETFLPSAHQLHHYLHLASALGADPTPVEPRLIVARDEISAAQKKFGIDPGALWLGLNAGAEYGPAKRWPLDRFAATARELQRRTACGWLIFGGPGDVKLGGQLAKDISVPGTLPKRPGPVVNLAGATGLRELCALLKSCSVLLTNDTGPMHLAAALGVPVAVPFGSTSPELTGPGIPGAGDRALLVSPAACAPCFRRECPIDFRCMTGIQIPRMVEAVLGLLPVDLRAGNEL